MGSERHGKAQGVGRAVKGDDERTAHGRNSTELAPDRSVKATQTHSGNPPPRKNLLVSANSASDAWAQFPLAIPHSLKTRRLDRAEYAFQTIHRAMAGSLLLTMLNNRPSLTSVLHAVIGAPQSPNRLCSGASTRRLLVAPLGAPKSVAKHCHTLPSCCSANCAVSSGLTMRNQKLALVAPPTRSSNDADCKSGTAGIRWNNNRCSLDFRGQLDKHKF